MNKSRGNWSSLQQMSYETNKRLRKHSIQVEKQKELEQQQQQRILNERRIYRQHKVELLKKRMHNLTKTKSECSFPSDNSNHTDSNCCNCTPSKRSAALNIAKFTDSSNNQMIEKSVFDGATHGSTVGENCSTETNLNKVNTNSCKSLDHGSQRFSIPLLKELSSPNCTDRFVLRRSQSADEIVDRKPTGFNTPQTVQYAKHDEYISIYTPVFRQDSISPVISGTKHTNSFSNTRGTSLNCPLQSDISSCLTLNWLHTGTPPLSDSLTSIPVEQNSPSKTDQILQVTNQLRVADNYSHSTVSLDNGAPIYSIANGHPRVQNQIVPVSVKNLDFTAIPETANTITPIPSPKESKISSHLHFVVPRSHTINETFPMTTMSIRYAPQVSGLSHLSNETTSSSINPTCFFQGNTTSLSIRYPHLPLDDPKTCVSSTFWTNLNSPHYASTGTNKLNEKNDQLFSGKCLKPHSVENVISKDAQNSTTTPMMYHNSPLRSILKSRPMISCSGFERLPGFHDNFSELTALRTRDSMDLAPTRLRLLSAPDVHLPAFGRNRSPDTAESSETDQSGSPRSQRKTVRFADELGKQTMRLVNPCSSSIASDMTSVNNQMPSVSIYPTLVNPVSSAIYPEQENDNAVHHSTMYDAPIRNTILPSLNQTAPSCVVSSSPEPTAQLPKPLQNADILPSQEPTSLERERYNSVDGQQKSITLGKPPLQPQTKSSIQHRYIYNNKPGYADLMVGRPRRILKSNAINAGNNKSGSSFTTVFLNPSPTTLEEPATCTYDSPSSYPPFTIADRVSPILWKIPSLRNVSGPPAVKRDLRDLRTPGPKLVNTTKLNDLTRAVTEPRNVTSPIIDTQHQVNIPSAFNTVKLTHLPTNSESENRAAMTRLTELNYETSLTISDTSTTLPITHFVPILPEYEGMDSESSKKLKMQQSKQAFQHAIYLSGQSSMNQQAHKYTGLNLETPSGNSELTNYSADHGGASYIPSVRSTRSSPNIVNTNQANLNRVLDVNYLTDTNDIKSLPPSGRLLNRRPRIHGFGIDSSMKASSCPLNSVISNAYTLERHKLGHQQNRRNGFSSATHYTSSPDVGELSANSTRKPFALSPTTKPKCTLINRFPIRMEEFDSEDKHQQITFPSTQKSSSARPSIDPRWAISQKTSSVPNATVCVPSDSIDKVSDSLAEFIKSERTCDQAGKSRFETSKPVHCNQNPLHANVTSLKRQNVPDTASTMSIEEARLLKSLERLNNRLCYILSDR